MILQLKDIHISFTNAQKETLQLLRGVNLNVEEGKITALVGGNGTGKTTLFNVISGFEKNYTGNVLFRDINLNQIPAHRISSMGIARLFQGGQLLGGLTLKENMLLSSDDKTGEMPFSSLLWRNKYKLSEEAKQKKVNDILVRFFGEENKYLEMLDRDASSFSYGEQRILSLLRLLMGNVRLLLLDEPTSGVNPVYINTIKNVIHEMKEKEGLTLLLIEHNMHFVRKVADTCAYLDDGIIAQMGSPAEVLDDKNVRNSYLGL